MWPRFSAGCRAVTVNGRTGPPATCGTSASPLAFVKTAVRTTFQTRSKAQPRGWAVAIAQRSTECSHQRYNGVGMAKSGQRQEIDVTFDGEVLRPHEPLELEPNRTYRIQIEPAHSKRESQNSLLRILDLARDFGLTDLAEQHDHYLYATPKK